MNALVLLSTLLDAALLSSAFSVNEVEAVLKSTSCWYIASGITIAWLVVMSMPHAMSQDGCLKCLGPLQKREFREKFQGLLKVGPPATVIHFPAPISKAGCMWEAYGNGVGVLGVFLNVAAYSKMRLHWVLLYWTK